MAKPKKAGEYTIELLCNGETTKTTCSDIEKGILSLKPVFVHTDSYMTIYKNGEIIAERRLPLIKARMLFANEDFRAVFINNLLLK